MSRDNDELPAWQECMTSQICEWLDANYGEGITGALTGTDWKAMRAIVALLEAYSYCRNNRLISGGFWSCVSTMQDKNHWMAWAIIAMVLNWQDRDSLWRIGIGEPPKPPRRARYDDSGGPQ